MRAESHGIDVLALQLDPGFDQIGGEDVTGKQVIVVCLQVVQYTIQAVGNRLHRSVLLRWQLVQILVDRCRWLRLVQNAVYAGQQDCREGQVRIRGRIWATELNALDVRVGASDRDAHGGRAVTRAVDQIDRRLEARNQPVVGVHRRIGEGQQRWGVLENATD